VRDCRGHGRTGHCLAGKHQQCPYSPGGVTERGIWTPECYITMPGGWVPRFVDGQYAAVVKPSHVYRCPCDCHQISDATGQLELFEAAS
jgi:hypothetical protein